MRWSGKFGLGLVLLLIGSGCGGAKLAKLYPVTGTVTYDGKPLANASVLLVPETGAAAIGQTDGEGHFSLRTQGTEGAVEGPAKIAVTATENVKKVTAEEFEKMTDAERAKASKSLIPPRYGNPEASELTTTVSTTTKNEIQLDLTK